jgi:hypothetical protein
MIKYDISNHPHDDEITRKAELDILEFKKNSKSMIVQIEITHYKNGTLYNLIPNGYVKMVADISTWVNQFGEIVPKEIDGYTNPEALMTEFDFFTFLATQPISIESMVQAKIQWLDSSLTEYRINTYINI